MDAYSPALEMMKNDPAIQEVVLKTPTSTSTLFRGSDCIAMRTETADGFSWNDILWVRRVSLCRSSAVNNITEEELAAEGVGLRIQTPPRTALDDFGFSTPSPRVRRAEPPALYRNLPAPSWPLERCCGTGTTMCSDFTCILSPTPPPPKVARHLFFDEEGNACSYEEHEAAWAEAEAEEEDFGIKLPAFKKPLIVRHPRILLSFFRFLMDLNEEAYEDEKVMLPEIPSDVLEAIGDFLERHPPAPEFAKELAELHYYLNLFGEI